MWDASLMVTPDQAENMREHYEERAAIIEHDGGFSRAYAEHEARESVRRLGRRLYGGGEHGET